ncbi:predicted protein [Botrytis cinerea T4]|uniref:Uncharacterized protein n=1 Tax=Botryotinia fuckeliana (strain T4) TaxID=999810 RepID=G2XVU4_BOTF4|nr:predicted protein [Botrytis cinerea T4]
MATRNDTGCGLDDLGILRCSLIHYDTREEPNSLFGLLDQMVRLSRFQKLRDGNIYRGHYYLGIIRAVTTFQ